MSSSSSSPAEAKRAETDPRGDESGGESVPQAVSQDALLTETREFPPDASVSAPNLIASDEAEPIAAATEALAGALGNEETEGQDADVRAEAVVESAIDDSQLTGVEAEAQADVEEIAEFDEELEADIEEEIEEPAEASVQATSATSATESAGALTADAEAAGDEDELVIDAEADAVDVEAENRLGGESLRPELAAALADEPAFPEQITPAPEALDAPFASAEETPFATASADEDFLRRVVLPPPPMPPAGSPLPAVGAPPMAELTRAESDDGDRTVISEPPSPAMLAALASPPAPHAATPAVPFAGWQGRGGRRVSLTPLQLGSLLLVAAVGGGFAGGMLRPPAPAVAVPATAAGPSPAPVITPLPAQEDIIPRVQPARPAAQKPAAAPTKTPAPVAAEKPAAPATKPMVAPVAKAPATPPAAAPAKPAAAAPAPTKPAAVVAKPAAPAAPTTAVRAPERPARRTAVVHRRPVAKKKKFVDPFE